MAMPASEMARQCLKLAEQHHRDLVQEVINVCQIPAPTLHERERARHVAQRLQQVGLTGAHVDDAGNAVAYLSGRGEGPALLLCAHLDTVFPPGTDCTVRREGEMLKGPGVGDNAACIGAMIWAARILHSGNGVPSGDVIFAGTVGEEGLGNLRGIKALMQSHGARIGQVLVLDGTLGGLVCQAVGSRRLRAVLEGEGGHAWGAFGTPSAIHALARAITRIYELRVPVEPRTTYNVGLISGGTAINSIASQAEMTVDLRSVNAAELERLEARVRQLVQQAAEEGGLSHRVELVGERPAGAIPFDHPLCLAVQQAHRELGIQTRMYPSSTDGNVPLSLGIPAVAVGVTHGGNGYRTDEYIYTEPLVRGLAQVLLLVRRLVA